MESFAWPLFWSILAICLAVDSIFSSKHKRDVEVAKYNSIKNKEN